MLLIFDLDGTLIDSSQDLAISMNATREHMGTPPLDPKLIFSYVGNGAPTLVRRAMGPGASEETVAEALAYFLKFYRVHALEHTRLYDGVRETIDALAEQNHAMAVLTNKPVRISTDIIAALGLSSQFRQVYGGDSFPVKKPDPIGINRLRDEIAAMPEDTLMIGDSAVDVQTARNAGVSSCGVQWGFQPESFEAHPPDFLVANPRDLLQIIAPESATLPVR
ncbi:MAG: HAD family hydrolase [Bryobacteraceae bacterium]